MNKLKPDIENITVFSDASYCPKTKAAGGAFWARGTVIKLSEAFPLASAEQSHEAEIMAACHAILSLATHPEFGVHLAMGPKTRVVLVIDCLAVQDVLQHKASIRISPAARKMVTEVLALQRKLKFWLKVNHVKAHQGVTSPKSWVNNWCDVQSRKHMLTMRQSREALA